MDAKELIGRLHWLGHDSFRWDGPPVIYFDPWQLRGRPPVADLVLVSHEHHDHCSPEDVERLSSPGTVIVASHEAAARLRGDVRPVQPGDSVRLGEVEIEAVPAYNINKPFHPKASGHVGYVVGVGGERLYFAGDTDRIPEMVEIRCDVALLPVSGIYVMTAEEAAEAAKAISPKVAIPMHYASGVAGTLEDAKRFRDLSSIPTVILQSEGSSEG